MTDRVAANDLAVIIPTRDRWPILRRTLAGLAAQTITGFETIVVVDGVDQVPPELDGVRVVQKEHGGPGAARNAGVAASSASLILFLGDDMVPTPRLVERHLAAHARHTDTVDALVGHVVWHPDVHRDRLLRWMDWSGTQFDFRTIVGDDAGWPRFYSCNVSLKRALFDATGGFDESFTYYYEDLDLGWRLHEQGLRLRYDVDALAHHLHPYTWDRIESRFRGIAAGERHMAEKHAWFEPFFANRIRSAAEQPAVSKFWPLVVDRVPNAAGRLRRGAERRADRWYHQRLAPAFLASWDGRVDHL